jgi:hypothetical protein
MTLNAVYWSTHFVAVGPETKTAFWETLAHFTLSASAREIRGILEEITKDIDDCGLFGASREHLVDHLITN